MKIKTIITAAVTILSCFCFVCKAWALEPIAKVIISDSPKIKDLTWDLNAPAIKLAKVEFDPEKEELSAIFKKIEMTIKVKGRFAKIGKGWTLLLKDKAMNVKPDGSFEINFLMAERSKFVDLTAVSDEGVIENERVGVEIVNFEEFSVALKIKKSPHLFSVQLGGAGVNYSQKNVPEVSQKVVELRAQYRLNILPDRLHLELVSQADLPVSKAEPDFGKMIFLEAEGQMFYKFWVNSKMAPEWQARVGGGMFSKSMLVSPARYGYALSSGILVEPEGQYSLLANHSLTVRVALGFVTSNFNPIYIFSQQFRRIRLRWHYSIGEKESVFAEVFLSQFLLNRASVNEIANGIVFGYQFP